MCGCASSEQLEALELLDLWLLELDLLRLPTRFSGVGVLLRTLRSGVGLRETRSSGAFALT